MLLPNPPPIYFFRRRSQGSLRAADAAIWRDAWLRLFTGQPLLEAHGIDLRFFFGKSITPPQSLLSFMNSSTSSNKIEPPIDIFNRFLFLSLLGCQHLSLSRAEADVAVSGCVEKLFEKNLFHASIVPHVFALMQNKALLSQWISQSLSSVDSFLAATDLSWNAGLWADSHFYGRPPPR